MRKHFPLKISRAEGQVYTICVEDEAEDEGSGEESYLSILQHNRYILGLNPHLMLIKRVESVRTVRPHVTTPYMSLLEFISLVALNHQRVLLEYKKERCPCQTSNEIKTIVEVVKGCTGSTPEHQYVPRIKIKPCVEKLREFYEKAWTTFIGKWLGIKNENVVVDEPEILDTTLKNLFMLKQYINYSIFIRNLLIFVENKTIEFNLKNIINKIFKSPLKELEWFVANHCCYSSLSHYPALLWFATVFGTELPSGTMEAYQPWSLEVVEGERPKLRVKRALDVKEFGFIEKGTAERYSKRYELDAVIMTAAIDLFITYYLYNPWYRASVLSSFSRTLLLNLSKNIKIRLNNENIKNLIAIPVIYPPKYLHKSVRNVATPRVYRVDLDPEVANIISKTIRTLNEEGASRDKIARASIFLANLIESEYDMVKNQIVEKINNVLEEEEVLSKRTCIRGLALDILHPFAYYILADYVYKRPVAYSPSPSLELSLMYLFMSRLTKSEEFTVLLYYLVDFESIKKSLHKYREIFGEREDLITILSMLPSNELTNRILITRENNKEKIRKRIDIETIAQALIDVSEYGLKGVGCLEELAALNEELVDIIL